MKARLNTLILCVRELFGSSIKGQALKSRQDDHKQIQPQRKKLSPSRIGVGSKIHENAEFLGEMDNITLGDSVSVGRDATLHCYDSNSSIDIGDRSVIKQFVQILTHPEGRIRLGQNCSVNPFCVLYGLGGLDIGDNVRIATHTVIIPANHIFDDLSVPINKQGLSKQGVVIEDDVWVGAGVTILDGCRIGKGAVIAAGAVVNIDVEPFAVAGGVPCKVLKMRTPNADQGHPPKN